MFIIKAFKISVDCGCKKILECQMKCVKFEKDLVRNHKKESVHAKNKIFS